MAHFPLNPKIPSKFPNSLPLLLCSSSLHRSDPTQPSYSSIHIHLKYCTVNESNGSNTGFGVCVCICFSTATTILHFTRLLTWLSHPFLPPAPVQLLHLVPPSNPPMSPPTHPSLCPLEPNADLPASPIMPLRRCTEEEESGWDQVGEWRRDTWQTPGLI